MTFEDYNEELTDDQQDALDRFLVAKDEAEMEITRLFGVRPARYRDEEALAEATPGSFESLLRQWEREYAKQHPELLDALLAEGAPYDNEEDFAEHVALVAADLGLEVTIAHLHD